jgi:hypothetical protein
MKAFLQLPKQHLDVKSAAPIGLQGHVEFLGLI